MSRIDKIIFDALAKRQSVVLPGVGSLVVMRRAAKKMPGDRIIPPQNVVTFTQEEIGEGQSVVALLVSIEGASEVDAVALYDSWLEGARSERGVTIEDVGEIHEDKFVITQALHTALNPVVKESVELKKSKKCACPWLCWAASGVVIVGIVLVLCSYFGNGFLGIQKKPKAVAETVVPVADTLEVATVEEVVVPTVVEHAFHVIAGSFTVESNADNYVAKLQNTYPTLSVQKIKSRLNGNWLVSIFNAPTEREAYNKMNRSWEIDSDLWVYEQK
jgi:hypothetical protein